MAGTDKIIEVNGRRYAWPDQPLVAVCVDGSEPDYIECAIAAGVMPVVGEMVKTGADLRADCVVPSFTNPNNLSIVTGVPPVVHGICGNYFYDRESDAEVMMNDPKFLRTGTLLWNAASRRLLRFLLLLFMSPALHLLFLVVRIKEIHGGSPRGKTLHFLCWRWSIACSCRLTAL